MSDRSEGEHRACSRAIAIPHQPHQPVSCRHQTQRGLCWTRGPRPPAPCPSAPWPHGPICLIAIGAVRLSDLLSDLLPDYPHCLIARRPPSVRDYLLRLGYLSAIDITCHQHDCGIRETETRAMTMHDHELLMYDRGHSLHDLPPSFRD